MEGIILHVWDIKLYFTCDSSQAVSPACLATGVGPETVPDAPGLFPLSKTAFHQRLHQPRYLGSNLLRVPGG